MVNGMSVNGLGEVSMDTTQTIINSNMMANNLIALGLFFNMLFFLDSIVFLFSGSFSFVRTDTT